MLPNLSNDNHDDNDKKKMLVGASYDVIDEQVAFKVQEEKEQLGENAIINGMRRTF